MSIDLTDLAADIILRKSRATEESLDEIFSKHRPRLIDLAERHHLQYTIIEDIVSGASSADPEKIFGQVMQKAALGLSRVWVCMDVDRLARPDMETTGRILKCVLKHRVYILTPDRLYDPTNLDDITYLKIKFFLSEMELDSNRKRASRSRDAIVRKESRYSCGAVPFGYRRVGKSYEPDPIAYPIVEYAWSLAPRYGVVTIYRMVSEKFKSTGPIRAISAYFDLFRNPFYAGYPVLKPRREISSSIRERPDWIWPEKEGDYPHPVSLDEWREAQAIIDMRLTQKTKSGANTWARGVLRFAQCGLKAGGNLEKYRCNPQKGRRTCNHSINQDKVHATLEMLLAQIFGDPRVMRSIVRKARAALEHEDGSRSELLARVKHIQDEITRRDGQLRKLIEAYTSMDGLSEDAGRIFREQVSTWQRELDALRENKSGLQIRLSSPSLSPGMIDALEALSRADFREWWKEMEVPEKKAIADFVFRSVTIDQDAPRHAAYISAIEMNEGLPEILLPPQELQAGRGLRAAELAVRVYHSGQRIRKDDFIACIDKPRYAYGLYRRCQEWLGIPDWIS